jgi:hypothetical protein
MPRQSDLFAPAHSPFGFPSTRAAPATACSRPAYCVFSSYRRVVCGGLRTNGKCGIAECGKNKNKPKLNLSVRAEERNKLEQMASLENRSLSNLVEVMADVRWKRLAEQQGVGDAARPS